MPDKKSTPENSASLRDSESRLERLNENVTQVGLLIAGLAVIIGAAANFTDVGRDFYDNLRSPGPDSAIETVTAEIAVQATSDVPAETVAPSTSGECALLADDPSDIVGADLTNCVTSDGVDLRDANLSNVNASGLEVIGGEHNRVIFQGANLTNSRFGGNFNDADFGGASLEGAIFDGADLSGAHFGGANLDGTVFAGSVECKSAAINFGEFTGTPKFESGFDARCGRPEKSAASG